MFDTNRYEYARESWGMNDARAVEFAQQTDPLPEGWLLEVIVETVPMIVTGKAYTHLRVKEVVKDQFGRERAVEWYVVPRRCNVPPYGHSTGEEA